MEQLLQNLYSSYQTFSPEKLVEYLEIELKYVNFLDNPKAQYIMIRDKKIILVKDSLQYSNEKHFIIAHELFHAIKHSDLIGYYSISSKAKNKLEYEANCFAVKLLFEHFVIEHESLPDTFQEMTYHYGIPSQFYYLINT